MSTKQPNKTKPLHPHSKHGPLSKATPQKGSNAQQPRSVRAGAPNSQAENMQEPDSSKNASKKPIQKQHDGGGATQTSQEQTEKTGNAGEPKTKVSDVNSHPSEKHGAESDKTYTDEAAKVDSKQKDGENENKPTQSKKKPKNKKSNESEQSDRGKHEKHTQDKKKPNKKKADEDSKQNRGKDTTLATCQSNGKNKNSDADSELTAKENDDKKSRSENEPEETQPKVTDSAQNEEENEGLSISRRQERKASLDDDSLQMFLSSDDYPGQYTADGRPWMGPDQYSDETKRKQEEIIRRILAEFDMEETMRKYRNSNVYVYRRNGKSLADFRFRSELIRMMGSEDIRLNDQEWSKRFQKKLKEDYERLLDEQEHSLAKAEKQRLHRLRVEGVIQDPDVGQGPDGAGSNGWPGKSQHHSSKNAGAGKKRSQNGRGRQAADSGDIWDSEPKPVFADEESDRRERALVERRQERVYHPSDDVQTQMSRLKSEEREMGRERVEKQQTEKESRSQEFSSVAARRSTMDEGERKRQQLPRSREKRYKNLPPNVAKLYEEETVSGLYKMAAEMLYPGSTAEPSEGKSKGVRIA